MTKKLNRHAVIAWMYVWETVRECPADEVDKGYEFKNFIVDMHRHYGAEFEAFLAVKDAFMATREGEQ